MAPAAAAHQFPNSAVQAALVELGKTAKLPSSRAEAFIW